MPDLDKLFPGRFIKASEFGGKAVTVTLTKIAPEKVKSHINGGKEETLAVAWLKESPRQWHLNRTNAACLSAMFGRDYATWAGHRVTLFADKDESGLGESGVCIRVKGSPELTRTVVAKIKNPGRGEPKERKLTPTGNAPAMVHEPEPRREAVCVHCGFTVALTPDATPDDMAGILCEGCGEPMGGDAE